VIDSRHGLGLGRGSLTGHKMTHCQLWADGPYDGSEGGPSERVAGRRSVVLPLATRSDGPLPDPSSRRHIVRPLGFESRWRKEICLCMGIFSQFLRSKLCTERHLTRFCKLFNQSQYCLGRHVPVQVPQWHYASGQNSSVHLLDVTLR